MGGARALHPDRLRLQPHVRPATAHARPQRALGHGGVRAECHERLYRRYRARRRGKAPFLGHLLLRDARAREDGRGRGSSEGRGRLGLLQDTHARDTAYARGAFLRGPRHRGHPRVSALSARVQRVAPPRVARRARADQDVARAPGGQDGDRAPSHPQGEGQADLGTGRFRAHVRRGARADLRAVRAAQGLLPGRFHAHERALFRHRAIERLLD